MKPYNLFAALAAFLNTVSCAPPSPSVGLPNGRMEKWSARPNAPPWVRDTFNNFPTWYAQYPTNIFEIPNPGAYESNLGLAKAHFEWLQRQNFPNWLTDNGNCLVSVMFDPKSKWHFVSTIPRKGRAAKMSPGPQLENTIRPAPLWWAQIGAKGPLPTFHAEDGVFFNYESSQLARTENGRYPDGCMIATWGQYHDKDGNVHTGEVPACYNTNDRDPTCQGVASRLGVSFSPVTNFNQPAAAADTGEPGGGTFYGLTEDQINELICDDFEDDLEARGSGTQGRRVAIRGREVAVQKRDACAATTYRLTPVSTFTDAVDAPLYTPTYPVTAINTPQSAVLTLTTDQPTTAPPTTPAPMPSCIQHFEDPDQGINTVFCVCDGSRTLPWLTISPQVVVTKSCDYTSLPPPDAKRDIVVPRTMAAPQVTVTPTPTLADKRDLTITTGFGPPTTDTKMCQVCTREVVNEDSCSSLENCIPQTGAMTIEAGTSSVHVGTLTGTALFTSVSSALDKICPTPSPVGQFTGCSADSVAIKDIPYEELGFLATDGELVVSVESSLYNETSLRDALIRSAAAAAQYGAANNNCYEATYEVEEAKRSVGPWWMPSMFRRDHPHPVPGKATWCNTVGFAGPHYYNPWWRLQSQPGASDYIDAHYEFHVAGGGEFDCAILESAAGALAFLAPEFVVADIELGSAIGIACNCVSEGQCLPSDKRSLDNSTLIDG